MARHVEVVEKDELLIGSINNDIGSCFSDDDKSSRTSENTESDIFIEGIERKNRANKKQNDNEFFCVHYATNY